MLAWDQPRAVNVAHVTFERRAVPVRIEADLGGQWRLVGRISRLDQRRYVVPLDAVTTTPVRLVFARPAAVCEVRIYDEPPTVAEAIRATNVPVTVTHAGGQTTVHVNQRLRPPIDAQFIPLGTFLLDDHSAIRIDNTATDGYVVVDGLQLLPEPRADGDR